jgi:phosphate acyltransferase
MMRVALDAMGGDHAPREIVAGAAEAVRDLNVDVILVGPDERLRHEIRAGGFGDLRIVDAPEVIGMAEAPAMALRRKRRSSIAVALELVRRGEADAMVSAGNTGAVMAAALLTLRPIEGIDRPAIAAVLPTQRGRALMVDAGANVDCRPKHLLQFAVMGSVYAQRVMGVPSPRVGLLSNGEEDTKGNELVIRAGELLRRSELRFIGNVEGRGVFAGDADVVVCDGFVGNAVLKFGEGLALGIFSLLREELSRGLLVRLGVALARPRLRALARRLDHTEYGGAPLLGVDGICIVSHGSSHARAVRNAIALAADSVRSQMVEAIRADVARLAEPAAAQGGPIVQGSSAV